MQKNPKIHPKFLLNSPADFSCFPRYCHPDFLWRAVEEEEELHILVGWLLRMTSLTKLKELNLLQEIRRLDAVDCGKVYVCEVSNQHHHQIIIIIITNIIIIKSASSCNHQFLNRHHCHHHHIIIKCHLFRLQRLQSQIEVKEKKRLEANEMMCACACVRACVCVSMCVWVTCRVGWVCECVCACINVCVRACIRVYLRACVPSWLVRFPNWLKTTRSSGWGTWLHPDRLRHLDLRWLHF